MTAELEALIINTPRSLTSTTHTPMGVALCLMSLAVRTKPSDPTSNEPANCSLLLKLPDELLLFIAQRLCDNGDLCRFSLVCRKLKDIAQEALLKEVVLPTYTLCSMRELVRALCDRPDLCDKIRSVDLGGYSCPGHPTHVFGGPEEDYFYKCRGLVGEEVFDKTIDRYASVQPTWPRLREQPFFLDVLIAACPNIKGLTLRLPGVLRDQVFLGEYSHGTKIWVADLVAYLQATYGLQHLLKRHLSLKLSADFPQATEVVAY